jgi:hypothetical protein
VLEHVLVDAVEPIQPLFESYHPDARPARRYQREAGWLAVDAVKVALQPESLGELQRLGACQLVGFAGCLALIPHPGREHGQCVGQALRGRVRR